MSAEEGRETAKAETDKAEAAAVDRTWIERLSDHGWVLIAMLVPAAIVVGMIQGAAAALLVLVAAALVTVIALFWGSVRTLLGETPLSGADAYALAAPRAEEEQKQAVLRALKDIEFERSVGKISEEDYAALVAKYRAEAKRLLRLLDEDAKPRRERVAQLVHARLVAAGLEAPEAVVDTHRSPPPAEEKEKKKKKKRKAAEPPADAATAEPAADAPERRVLIEPIEPPEPEKRRPKAPVDITWKSPLPTKTKASAAHAPAAKQCAECGTKNDPDANFCKKCGSKAFAKSSGKVEAAAAAASNASPEPASEAKGVESEHVTEGAESETKRSEGELAEAAAKGADEEAGSDAPSTDAAAETAR
jgi:hypothetical protein